MPMDFVDWRKSPDKSKLDPDATNTPRSRMRKGHYVDYIEELIREAEEQGKFSNLEGLGKPLNLEDDSSAGDMAMAYHMLKSNGYAPREIELAKEIRTERERAEAKLAKIVHQGRALRSRRVPPFASERRAFNATVEKAAEEYEQALRNLNSKILTLNLVAPPTMHQPLLEVESLLRQFRESCPPFNE